MNINNEINQLLNKVSSEIKNKHFQSAQSNLERILRLDPSNSQAIHLSSIIATETNHLPTAAELGLISVRLSPENIEFREHYAWVLKKLNLIDKAIAIISEGIQLNSSVATFFKIRGNNYLTNKDYENAINDFNQSIKLGIETNEIFNSLGVAHAAVNDYQSAITSYKKAIELKPNSAIAYSNLAVAYKAIDEYSCAEQSIKKAISLDPHHPKFYLNLSSILSDQNNLEEAAKSLEIALSIKPDYADALYNLSLIDLAQGKFENAWKNYDYRWKVESFNATRFGLDRPFLSKQHSTNNLIIFGEQGLGDQILSCALLKNINSFAKKTYVVVDCRLIPLLQRSFPEINFIKNIDKSQNYDHQIYLGSIGKLFLERKDDLLNFSKPYLVSNKQYAEGIRASLGKENKILCGISWKSAVRKIGKNKSFSLNDLLPLLSLPNIQFVSLQYGDVSDEINEFYKLYGIKILECETVDNTQDIDGLASLIEACDFVVTCSNTTTHIVGGLGKECYLMTPSNAGSLWYWGNVKDGRSLWYPSIQIFKQPSLNNWAGAMNLIVDKIKQKYLV